MKTIIKTLGMVLLVLATINVKASDALDIKVNEQQNLIVELQGIEKGAVLSLLGQNGEILFKDRFSTEKSFSKIFSFENLEDGIFTLILEKEFSISTSVIKKEGKEIRIDETGYIFSYKPLFKINGDEVALYLANPEETIMQIEIVDKFGESLAIFKSKDLILKKRLDFSNVPAGDYTVKIKTKNNNFTKKLTLG